MEDQKRSILPSMLIALVVTGAYVLWNPPGQPSGEQASAPATAAGAGAGASRTPTVLTEAQQAARRSSEQRVTIRTNEYLATFTNRNAALVSFVLLDRRYDNVDGSRRTPEDLVSTSREELLPLRQTLRGVRIPLDAVWTATQVDPRTVTFQLEADGFRVERTIRSGRTPYMLESDTRVESLSAAPRPVRVVEHVYRYVAHEDEGSSFLGARSPAITQGLCKTSNNEIRELRTELVDPRGLGPSVEYAGWGSNYFTMAVAPRLGTVERCVVGATDRGNGTGTSFEIDLMHPRKVVAPGTSVMFRSEVFAGPKVPELLEAAGHSLFTSVDLGFFGIIAVWMVKLLQLIHQAVPNWGIAIILLTVLVRIVLYPLTAMSFKSMAKMRVVKPEMDRIQALYGEDQEKKGAALMALYKQHGINPAAGCLPALAQMPIWLALYTSLSTNIELYHASFAVWPDLSAPDPYYAMPLALAGLMYVQQKITPTTMDPMQAKIMLYMMPIMMGAFMLFLPAGLCVYMLTNSTLGIAQQHYVQWRLDQTVQTATVITAAEPAAEVNPSTKAGKKGSNRGRS